MPRSCARCIFGSLIATLLAAGCGGGGGGGPTGPGMPVIAAALPPNGATGVAYPGYTFVVSTGGVAPFAWSETGSLPSGLSLDGTGALTGTPTAAGTYSFTVMVSDASVPVLSASQPISLIVVDSPIVIAPPTVPAGTVSYGYSGFVLSVASGGTPPFAWSKTSGTVPPGLSFGSDGSLSGTPTAVGSFTFTATATDSATPAGTASQPIAIVINNPAPPVVGQAPAPWLVIVGTPYEYRFWATGGLLPLTWTVTAGALPATLLLNATGMISGTPTATGSYNFTVTVTDSAPTPQTGSAAFTLVVNNPRPPTINNTPPPTATVGVAYGFQFAAADGLAPLVWSAAGLPSGLGVDLSGVLSGTPPAAGHVPFTVDVKDSLNRSAPTAPFTMRTALARTALTFTATGSMTIPRVGHSATLLKSGQVLVAGGPDATAELYDPLGKMFTATGPMTHTRSGHAAALLGETGSPNDDKVLLVGGMGASTAAELYYTVAKSFTATGNMKSPRGSPTATLLNTGKVLIVGGNTMAGDLAAELFDPAMGTFAATGNTTVMRWGHTATRLADGRVLVTGSSSSYEAGMSAEIYDPSNGSFTAIAKMTASRSGHTATLLADGTVLIAGSRGAADLFDPGPESFAAVGDLPAGLNGPVASLLSDGTVLAAGFTAAVPIYYRSYSRECDAHTAFVTVTAAQLYAPESQGFVTTGPLAAARTAPTATVLLDGTVLLAGGVRRFIVGPLRLCSQSVWATPLATAELVK